MGRAFQTLTSAEIVQINRRMIEQFGGIFFVGNDNLLSPGSLDYLVEILQGTLLEFDPYPTVEEKAAILAWRIITGHIFIDGNKRTGMEACRLFLDLNGYNLLIDYRVVHTALQIAKHEMSFEDFVQWLLGRITHAP